jgi:hypothetical protein
MHSYIRVHQKAGPSLPPRIIRSGSLTPWGAQGVRIRDIPIADTHARLSALRFPASLESPGLAVRGESASRGKGPLDLCLFRFTPRSPLRVLLRLPGGARLD